MTQLKLKAYEGESIIDVEALYFNGYHIGERLLEDLIIKLTRDPKSHEPVITAKWPKGLDAKYWTAEALKFIWSQDVFSTTPEIDNDDGFIEFDQ